MESDDDLSKVTGTFDLIHSFIVLQHIATSRGEKIFRRMLSLLNEGGIGFLHFTYAKTELPLSEASCEVSSAKCARRQWADKSN